MHFIVQNAHNKINTVRFRTQNGTRFGPVRLFMVVTIIYKGLLSKYLSTSYWVNSCVDLLGQFMRRCESPKCIFTQPLSRVSESLHGCAQRKRSCILWWLGFHARSEADRWCSRLRFYLLLTFRSLLTSEIPHMVPNGRYKYIYSGAYYSVFPHWYRSDGRSNFSVIYSTF